jgi:putative salt-induced outer membrane protein YdiY
MINPKNKIPTRLLILATGIGLTFFSAVRTLGADGAPPPPPPKWESVAQLGVTLTRGNSENFLLNAGINSTRKWPKDELLLGASFAYGETESQVGTNSVTTKTDDYLKGFAQWNHLFSDRWYGGLRVEGVHDDIADVYYRFTFSPLVGYYFIKQTNVFLSVEVGPSYVLENVGGDEDSYLAARIGQRFEYKFKNGAKIWETLEFVPQVDDFENWILTAEIGIAAPITKALDIRLIAQDTYDNQPAPNREENDFKLIAGVGYKF